VKKRRNRQREENRACGSDTDRMVEEGLDLDDIAIMNHINGREGL